MKKISLIGSTGSIGTQTLEVVAAHPERFEVKALAARQSLDLLVEQALKFRPELVAILDESLLPQLEQRLTGTGIEVLGGMPGVIEAARISSANWLVSSLVGMAGLQPSMAALQSGKHIALANKETLVVAGQLMMEEARKRKLEVLPIDSEHSALFQCFQGQPMDRVERIIITASGGPFRKLPKAELPGLTSAQALKHPTWSMGAKITIDSASLMNKGFEVLEAHHLFGLSLDQIDVWVHPQSIIHSLVEFVDGSVLAQLGPPDMRTPISYALSYPDRWPPIWSRLELKHMKELTFEEPRWDDFPCLKLAFECGRRGGSWCAVLNAANEVAVEQFLRNRILFGDLARIIEATLEAHTPLAAPNLDQLIEVDRWARDFAATQVTSAAGTLP
ncbi:1-deoxy-D-xylulose-5-phosphate reductoisomerase [bacterium]|nr:1-deoxy-D-xylulose-5-phosphate reductoisomerase [bacterium]